MKKSAAVTIRLTPELKTLLVKRAQEQHRSITQYLEWLVMQDAAAARTAPKNRRG
ncbi:MAG: hypothetical protein IPK54_10435 [Dokdonella sp.]|uniref:hypothetical protein n=1 Tax=Dokdonella sp. TaxID=2291710 RepID=UPI0025B9C42D|nr:hypothetical protein [Dokdonella sp.]MBK8123948.1 hypothetical protein [Dokdonella sp.]